MRYIVWDGLKSISLEPGFLREDEVSPSPLQAYQAVSWVRRCVQLRASAIAGLPFEIADADGNAVRWPLELLLPSLLWLTEASLCLSGAAYWLKERRGRMLVNLRYLAPQTITPEFSVTSGLEGFVRSVGAITTRLSPDDLVWFWEPAPDVEIGPGRPVLEAALAAAGVAYNANRFVEEFFRRGAVTATLLMVEGNPPESEMRRLETWWKQMLRGVRRAWETVAVRASVKPQQIGVSPGKDLAVEGLLATARQQIAVAFGVPQTLIEDAANYATAREHRLSFYSETIVPRARWIEFILNERLFSPLGLRFRFRPDRLEVFQQDEATKAAALVQLVQAGIITPGEARQQLGLENSVPSVSPAEEKRIAEVKAILYDLHRWKEKARRAQREGALQDALEFRTDVVPPELAEYVRAALQGGTDPFRFLSSIRAGAEVKIEPDRRYERELRDKIAAVLGRYFGAVVEARTESEALAALVGLDDALRSAIEPVLVSVVHDLVLAEALAVGLYPDITAVSNAALQWATSYSYELVKGLTNTTREIVRHAIAEFVGTPGMTVGDLRRMLEPAFGPVRAEMIAITEVTRAANQATLIYQQLIRGWGLELVRVWRTSHDEHVCPVCGPNEGKPEWDWTFPDGPPAHPRCRCWTTLEARRRR